MLFRSLSFNPRPCARGDEEMVEHIGAQQGFQSTPLREGRHLQGQLKRGRNCFNPRPCARGDQLNQERSKVIAYVSIHAPARGATFQGLHVLSPIVLFQSTPLREGRQGRYARQFTSMMFQSTPLREGRRTHSMSRDLMRGRFQSTPLREGRPSRVSPARVF